MKRQKTGSDNISLELNIIFKILNLIKFNDYKIKILKDKYY